MEVSNGVGVVKLIFQPVENKFILFLPALNSHSQAPSSLQPGSLGMIHNMLMCCSLYYNDIAHLDPSASLICTMVVGREESTVTGSAIIGCSLWEYGLALALVTWPNIIIQRAVNWGIQLYEQLKTN